MNHYCLNEYVLKKLVNPSAAQSYVNPFTKQSVASSSLTGDIEKVSMLCGEECNRYVLLDWRQRFGQSVEVGDVYYDLAKLYHALMINGQSILQDMFDYSVEPFPDYSGDVASVKFYSNKFPNYPMHCWTNDMTKESDKEIIDDERIKKAPEKNIVKGEE